MTRRQLTVEISRTSPAVLRVLTYLLRDPRLTVNPRLIRGHEPVPRGRVLRIEPGSLVEPVLTLGWGEDTATEHDGNDVDVALNSAIWSADGLDSWRLTSAPLPRRVRFGHPDERRPWVLVAPGVDATLVTVERLTALHAAQTHHISPRGMPADAVLWPPTGHGIASLLGHVDAVLAPPGPLAWDAARVGVPVLAPERPQIPADLVERQLSRTVPALLAQEREFWNALVGSLLAGEVEPSWGTASWVRQARQRRADSQGEPRWQRKLLKFQRDPAAFWADSWLARVVRGLTRRP